MNIRDMSYGELASRKKKLEEVLEVLTHYDLDSVCQELGEINYLLAPDKYAQGDQHARH